MKKTLSIILSLSMLLSAVTTVFAAGNPFVDVAEDAWYHDEVVKAVETGIINGKSATEFKPDDLLTYAEAVKLAACMNQVYLNGEVTLTSGEPWYKPYADYCTANKIITKDYNFNANATRAGYMEIFANALPDNAFKEINNIPNGSILDVNSGATYAHYVYKMYRAGIVTGVDDEHNCNPIANIKRCEVATIISRMMDSDKRVRFDMSDVDDSDNPKTENNTKNEPKDEPVNEPVDEPADEPEKEPADKPLEEPIEDPSDEPTEDVKDTLVIGNPTVDDQESLNPAVSVDYTEPTIEKQPEGFVADEYGIKYEAEVQVTGGREPYCYWWYYYTGYRNNTELIEDGEYVKGATSDTLVLSIEKENPLLGKKIYCKIMDNSIWGELKTDTFKVYGPFSMPVDESLIEADKYVLTGCVADGILKKGEKVSVIRNDKVIAIGVAEDLQMFGKTMDETVKGDSIGIVFGKESGVRPVSGDIVVKYQPSHVIDTSDIVN